MKFRKKNVGHLGWIVIVLALIFLLFLRLKVSFAGITVGEYSGIGFVGKLIDEQGWKGLKELLIGDISALTGWTEITNLNLVRIALWIIPSGVGIVILSLFL